MWNEVRNGKKGLREGKYEKGGKRKSLGKLICRKATKNVQFAQCNLKGDDTDSGSPCWQIGFRFRSSYEKSYAFTLNILNCINLFVV
jgi:hypothetical protein